MRFAALALVVVACSSADKAELADDARAGEVVAVTGKAEATLGGDTRVLAVGDAVYAGDRVRTGPDGELRVVLAHNGAVLNLGADKQVVLREHVAWRAEKATAGALESPGRDETAAAGRHAERSAADTAATARGGEAPDRAVAPDPDPERELEEAERNASSDATRARMEEQLREAELRAREAEMRARESGERKDGARKRSRSVKAKRQTETKTADLDPGGAAEAPKLADITTALERLRPRLAACKKHGAGAVTVEVTIAANGRPSAVTTSDAASEALATCVAAAVRTARFPASAGGGSFRQRIVVD